MRRTIISIDEDKCTRCGQCIPNCPEGALQIIDGKARLVSDFFCDGLGACIGTCPEGAISIIEREAEPYDESIVMETIARQGAPVIKAHLEHLASHGQHDLYNEAIEYLIGHDTGIPDHSSPDQKTKDRKRSGAGKAPVHGQAAAPVPAACPTGPARNHPFSGCPGSSVRSIAREVSRPADETGGSELRQWPVQLALLNPAASYFENADLLIAADCVPVVYAGFHADFLRDRIVIIFCPKLDRDIDAYIEKLAEIFTRHGIRSVTVLHMEVPCCSGVRYVVDRALEKSGKKIPVSEKTITIEGGIR